MYLSVAQYSDALKDFTDSINLAQESCRDWVDLRQVYAMRASIHAIQEDFDRAFADIDSATQIEPNNPFLPIYRIMLLGRQFGKKKRSSVVNLQDLSQAFGAVSGALANPEVAQFTQAIMSQMPPDLMQQKIQELMGPMGASKEYIEYLADQAKGMQGDEESILLAVQLQALAAQAAKNMLDGQFDRALNILNDLIINFHSTDPMIYGMRGEVYLGLFRYNEALDDLNFAIQRTPSGMFYDMRGRIYRRMKRYAEALNDARIAIEMMPELPMPLAAQALTYFYVGRYADALESCNHALAIDSGEPWYYYIRSLAHQVRNEEKDATADLSTAIELAKKNIQTDTTNARKKLELALYYLAN